MGKIHDPTPVLLLIAASSRYDGALCWAEERAVAEFGPLQLKSEAFGFTETDYYQATMGTGLKKQFLTFQELIDPGKLPEIKRATNDWELRYAEERSHPEPRPLNLDPGYLTLAKLVLASTKDHAHRIYLGEGIYAEVTLNYRGSGWRKCDWTYPDYQRGDYQEFFTRCRQTLRASLAV
ncbi:MAG: DUF4416 family protein [Pirellulales bacterium]|nr:DUF4416 family protein [Pirellulales bacterium]